MNDLKTPEGARWAVVFYARLGQLDEQYRQLSPRLRHLAMEQYGCLGMQGACENGLEITVTYWASEADIDRWREDETHRQARKLARERGWYQAFSSQRMRLA